VHLWDVHYDLYPPPPYDRMFDPDYTGSFAGHAYRHDPEFKLGMEPPDYEHVLALYDGEIRSTDDTIGRMLAALRSAGLLDNTLVVVTSDHGDEFLEHGGKGHRRTLFQEVLAVPLVFWAPGRLRAGVADVNASLIDVAPSILELLGLPPLDRATGQPLFSRDGAPVDDDRVALAELRFNARRPALTAAYDHPHKVIVDARRNEAQYFDLAADPGEQSPRNADSLEAGRRLLGVLDRFYAAPARRLPTRGADKSENRLPNVMEKRLRSLGYLE